MTKMVLKLCKDLWENIFHEVCASGLFGACIPEEDMYILWSVPGGIRCEFMQEFAKFSINFL